MTTNPPVGWYPDPDQPAIMQRMWNGTEWTSIRRPTIPPPPVPIYTPPNDSLTLGYVLAILFPIAGLIYGIAKIRVGGEKVIATSIAAWFLFVVIFYLL